eukprot:1727521-Pyramimonas_sp.AAC.1
MPCKLRTRGAHEIPARRHGRHRRAASAYPPSEGGAREAPMRRHGRQPGATSACPPKRGAPTRRQGPQRGGALE